MGRANLLAFVLTVGSNGFVMAGMPCPADLDQSGIVTGIDLAMLLGDWGACPPSLPGRGLGGGSASLDSSACPADLDASGVVNGFDLGILLGAWGDCPLLTPPKIIYTPVAHQFEPAPGIPVPGVVYDLLGVPQIDEVGDVLFTSLLYAPTLPLSADVAIFHGPPGKVMPILREGDQAPGLPPGVVIKSLLQTQERICETGQIVATAELAGPGVIAGVNDYALFIGNPRKGQPLTKLLQLGDPALGVKANPELLGLALGSDGGSLFGAEQSDNGTLALFALLKGPSIPPDVYHKAVWTGPPDNLQLVYRDGMPAPGLPAGVTFAWLDLPSINDLGQLAFRGLVEGPGITDDNDMGRWLGGPGAVQLVAWPGLPISPSQRDVSVEAVLGGLTCTNAVGDMYAYVGLEGAGIDEWNDQALYAGGRSAPSLIVQEGDAAPEAGKDVEVDTIGNLYINNQRQAWYYIRYRGPGIDETNKWAMYFGPLENPTLSLRDGEPAPTYPRGTTLYGVAAGGSLSAMNDVGDIVSVSQVVGPGFTPATNTVLWLHHGADSAWYPMLRAGDVVSERVVDWSGFSDLSVTFWQLTGGADGFGLSFNDQRQLIMNLSFTDGTHGIYVIASER